MDVLSLQRDWIAKRNEAAPEEGFLISEFDPEELTQIVQNAGVLHCAYEAEKLRGYILMTEMDEFTSLYDDPRTGQYDVPKEQLENEGYCYLYQIAVDREQKRGGIGGAILASVLSQIRRPVLTDILIEPLHNLASIRFFKKNGFRDAGVLTLAAYRDFGQLRSQVLTWKPKKF